MPGVSSPAGSVQLKGYTVVLDQRDLAAFKKRLRGTAGSIALFAAPDFRQRFHVSFDSQHSLSQSVLGMERITV